jgi:hypothetical protein
MTCSISIWERLEPRPRSSDISASMAAPVRDPLWFLTRQWQFGEFAGRDVGSLAYVDYFGATSGLPRFVIDGTVQNIDAAAPLERQTLADSTEPDLSLRVELGQLFADLLAGQVSDPAGLAAIGAALLNPTNGFALEGVSSTEELDPVDPATVRFLAVCLQRTVDGYALVQLAQGIAAGTATVPDAITTTFKTQVAAALANLLSESQRVFGTLGTADPAAWHSDRLEYDLQVVAVDPAGAGNATMSAEPNSKGEFDWYSFDVVAKNPTATETAPVPLQFTMIPSVAKFPGMPNPRTWYIEDGSKSYVDVSLDPTDIVKLLVTDMLLVQGPDWYLLPLKQTLGTAVMTKGMVVTDVFGHRTLIQSANQPTQPASLDRFALFAITDDATGQQQLTNYFVVPPSPGPLAQDGATLEDVRFGRDEMADMAWGIEEITESPIGEALSGRQRDAQIDAIQNLTQPVGDPSAALIYQIESKVPANWTPLLGVQPIPNDPSFQLERAAMLHPTSAGGVGVVPPVGRFLNPTDVPAGTPYRIVEEEVPRDGLRLVRTVSRSRWVDGSTHLWVSRRRLFGAGEAPSGLRFDSALSNPNQT